jgi:hypothetical protein|tara:strand:+ start:2198 stop:2350 length:153 start_codon:yes stop_codon:yes gene_type:complete
MKTYEEQVKILTELADRAEVFKIGRYTVDFKTVYKNLLKKLQKKHKNKIN